MVKIIKLKRDQSNPKRCIFQGEIKDTLIVKRGSKIGVKKLHFEQAGEDVAINTSDATIKIRLYEHTAFPGTFREINVSLWQNRRLHVDSLDCEEMSIVWTQCAEVAHSQLQCNDEFNEIGGEFRFSTPSGYSFYDKFVCEYAVGRFTHVVGNDVLENAIRNDVANSYGQNNKNQEALWYNGNGRLSDCFLYRCVVSAYPNNNFDDAQGCVFGIFKSEKTVVSASEFIFDSQTEEASTGFLGVLFKPGETFWYNDNGVVQEMDLPVPPFNQSYILEMKKDKNEVITGLWHTDVNNDFVYKVIAKTPIGGMKTDEFRGHIARIGFSGTHEYSRWRPFLKWNLNPQDTSPVISQLGYTKTAFEDSFADQEQAYNNSGVDPDYTAIGNPSPTQDLAKDYSVARFEIPNTPQDFSIKKMFGYPNTNNPNMNQEMTAKETKFWGSQNIPLDRNVNKYGAVCRWYGENVASCFKNLGFNLISKTLKLKCYDFAVKNARENLQDCFFKTETKHRLDAEVDSIFTFVKESVEYMTLDGHFDQRVSNLKYEIVTDMYEPVPSGGFGELIMYILAPAEGSNENGEHDDD